MVGWGVLQELLQPASNDNQEAPRCGGRLTFKARMADVVVVGEDVHRHVKRGASLPVCVPRGGVFRGIRGKAGCDPPILLGFIFPDERGSEAGL